jgi:hypothetical protein
MLEAVAVVATQTPSTKEPFELALELIVTEVGKNVGVTVREVPTKASEVTVRV